MKSLIILITVLGSVSCNQPKKNNSDNPSQEIVLDKKINQQVEQMPIACEYAEKLDKYIDDISNNPKKFVNGKINDNCVLLLMDSINTRSILLNDEKYYKVLSAICSISDGYVSEHLMTLMIIQYFKNLDKILPIVSKDICLREQLIYGLSMEVSIGGVTTMNKIKEHSEKVNLTAKDKELVKEIISNIDPSIFD